MEASQKGHKEIVQMFLQNENIKINQRDKLGKTALIEALFKPYYNIKI